MMDILDSTGGCSIMRSLILGLHGINLAAAYTKLSVSFSCLLLLALDELSHPTGVASPLEVHRKHRPIYEEHEAD